GLPGLVVVDDHCHAIGKNRARQAGPLYGVTECPKDRPFHQGVSCPLWRHRHDLSPHQLVAAARLGGRPGQELGDGHPPGFGLRGHSTSIPQFVVFQAPGEPARTTYRSISPNTMSMEPRMADTSASMWPLLRKSMAARCGKPGARILQR